MECITTSTLAIEVNGAPSGFFKPSRGIRQGCPLSPYIFILCSNVLSFMLEQGLKRRTLKGVTPARGFEAINNIMFADDLIILGIASLHEASEIAAILNSYSHVSGQFINPEKSSIHFSKKTPLDRILRMQRILQVHNSLDDGDKYLGSPFLLPRSKATAYSFLLNKIQTKLQGWKARLLSHAGRLVVIKAVLSSIPIYFMSSQLLSNSILKKLKIIFKNFFWGFEGDRRHIHLCSWEKICSPMRAGGLGVRNLLLVNKALILKLAWRLLTCPSSPWASLLTCKYLKGSSFWNAPKASRASWTWQAMFQVRDTLRANCLWEVGNGTSILICSDRWLPSYDLSSFKLLSHISRVSHLLQSNSLGWDWDLITSLFPPEVVHRIEGLRISNRTLANLDKLWWTPSRSGRFTCSSAYDVLSAGSWFSSSSSTNSPRFWHALWSNKCVLQRAKILIWKCFTNSLLVRSNLKRFLSDIDDLCPLCLNAPETTDHLFMHCPFARATWFCSKWGAHVPTEGVSLYDWLQPIILSMKQEDVAYGLALIWSIWWTRNRLVHQNAAACSLKTITLSTKGLLDEAVFTQGLDAANPIQSQFAFQLRAPWEPAEGDLIIWVDASWKKGPDGGLGIYILKADKSIGNGIAIHLLNCHDALYGEVSAVLYGLELLMNYPKASQSPTWLFSDSTTVVKAINELEMDTPWRIHSVIQDCKEILSTNALLQVCYTSRNSNCIAHDLANFVLDTKSSCYWYNFTPGVTIPHF